MTTATALPELHRTDDVLDVTALREEPSWSKDEVLGHFKQFEPGQENRVGGALQMLGYEFRYAEKINRLMRQYQEACYKVNGQLRELQVKADEEGSPLKSTAMLESLVRQRERMKTRIARLITPGQGWEIYFSRRIQALMVWQKVAEGQEPGFLP